MNLKTFAFMAGTLMVAGLLWFSVLAAPFAESATIKDPLVSPPPVNLASLGDETTPPASGTSVQGEAWIRLQQLADRSDMIILTGTVIAEARHLDGKTIVATLEVRDRLKGTTSQLIRIVQPNGEPTGPAGSSDTSTIAGHPLQSGESYLLFLQPQTDGAPDTYVIAGEHNEGKFQQYGSEWVNDDPAMTAALHSLSDAAGKSAPKTKLAESTTASALITGV